MRELLIKMRRYLAVPAGLGKGPRVKGLMAVEGRVRG
jgi:hypothetical protein